MIPAAALAPRFPTRERMDRRPQPPQETEYRPDRPLDLLATVAGLQRGPGDPAQTIDPTGAAPVIWRATRTPDGVATLALRQRADGSVRLAAWGPGREWAIGQAPALCGEHDDPTGFEPRHPLIAEAHRRHPGLRIGRSDLLFDALAQSITEQKVTLRQAFGSWRRVVTRFGERAPGPTPVPLFCPPPPDGWRRIPSWGWHLAGLEPSQARAIVEAATRAGALERAAASEGVGSQESADRQRSAIPQEHGIPQGNGGPAPASGVSRREPASRAPTHDTGSQAAPLDEALLGLRGIGPWTVSETRIRALGDPDAVSFGDYHLPHHVGYALTGSRVDDDGMRELLEPWKGQRYRVIRLIYASGVVEPRRGPRMHVEDHRGR